MSETIENSLSPEVQQLEHQLIHFHDLLRQQRHVIEDKFHISAQEMEILLFIDRVGAQKMKNIAEEFNIKLSTLTSTIDKAEKRKIVKRINSKKDRRVVYLEMTKKGRKLVEEYNNYLKDFATRAEQAFDSKEFELFVAGMEKLAEISVS